MPGPVIVPDASVLLKWALDSDDEQDRLQALALKGAWMAADCEIIVPTLWVYEVGNILHLKRAAGARSLLQAMVDLELDEATPSTYLDRIGTLIADHRVTFYDAAYHALAIHRHGTLVTADAAYVRKTAPAGHATLLSAWKPPR